MEEPVDFLKTERSRKQDWICAILLAVIILLVFFQCLNCQFLKNWDDGNFIIVNPRMKGTWADIWSYLSGPYQNIYSPTAMLSLMFDKVCFGLKPFWYHLHNLLGHIAGALMLMMVLRRLRIASWPAFVAALFWAVHPQRVESVAWIVERKDIACCLFAFSAVWAFLKAREALSMKATGWYTALCGISCLLSMGAKPASAALPGVFGIIVLWQDGFSHWRRSVRSAAVPVLLAFASVFFAMMMTGKNNAGFMEDDWRIILHNFFWYPATALSPWPPLHPIYPAVRDTIGPHSLLLWIAGIAALAAGAMILSRLAWKRYLPGLWSILLVAGVTLPVVGLLRYTDFDYCDRYNCLVSAAAITALTCLLNPWLRRLRFSFIGKRIAGFVAAIVLIMAASKTILYLPSWVDDVTFAIRIVNTPGIPNVKAVAMVHNIAFMAHNPGLLERVATLWGAHDYHTIRGVLINGEKSRVYANMANGHAAMLRKDYDTAARCLIPIAPWIEANMNTDDVSLVCGNFIFFDLVQLSGYRKDAVALRHYTLEAMKYLDRNLNIDLYNHYQKIIDMLNHPKE